VDVDAAVPGAAALLPSCAHGARIVGPWSCLVNESVDSGWIMRTIS